MIQKYCATHILSLFFVYINTEAKVKLFPFYRQKCRRRQKIKARTKWYKKPPGRASQSQQKWKHSPRGFLFSSCVTRHRPDESNLGLNVTCIVIIIDNTENIFWLIEDKMLASICLHFLIAFSSVPYEYSTVCRCKTK